MSLTNDVSWADLVSLAVGVASLVVTVAIFHLGRRLSFRQQRERITELEGKAWGVLGPIRVEGLNSKIIVMNVDRYKRGYDGSNELTWRGWMYTGPEMIDVDHAGVVVIAGVVESFYDDSGRRTLKKSPTAAPPVLRCGHIPWRWIEDISPNGDEFDGSAIFFVRHGSPGREPYDSYTYREAIPVPFGPHSRDYYKPIPDLGLLRPRPMRDWWRFARSLKRLRTSRSRRRGLR
ncbi:hypothetical protein LN996_02505 [Arthrobacter sp. AK01]|uniref:hypothetical protein n=1 Tax=Arthrobacter sp. AK01 TaxID=2894084 RepID=UPI001E3BE57A|nr:hypothetical protein [Arthrobacter sp. AK01]MCD4849677.1 hypothetical protein [Arthrobacter sp. AK01]